MMGKAGVVISLLSAAVRGVPLSCPHSLRSRCSEILHKVSTTGVITL